MNRQDALEQYLKAMKAGQKSYRSAVVHGKYPYPQVLDEILDESMIAGRVDLGVVEIPMDQIVGTKTAGRKNTFAANFMPLMSPETEFATKWIMLCMDHMGDAGIREPIRCFEYLGRFYVQEGNKRVSVLKSYEASAISGYVTRIIPAYSQDLNIRIYYEFMRFYQLAGLYQVRFPQPGSYAKLQAALGYDADYVWTQDERQIFLSRFSRFQDFFRKQGGDALEVTAADALLVWLRVFTIRDLKDMTASELSKSLSRVWPDVLLLEKGAPIEISTDPNSENLNMLSYLLANRYTHLNVAFFFHADPKISAFTRSHELGAEYVREKLRDSITVTMHYGVRADESGEWVMEKAVAEGAQVLFATAPPLIGACRKVAARHPELKVLNCSLSMPYTGVRTYYSRIYEPKFIAGAMAAAVSQDPVLGYVADYPIYGVPASINAFALGARMVNPGVRVRLEWSCVPGDPYAVFAREGIRTISNRELSAPGDTQWYWNQGTYRRGEDGAMHPIASPAWNWGAFYEKVIVGILAGNWDASGSNKAVGYWWGMNSGVTDVQLSPDLPDGVRALATCLRREIVDHNLEPFGFLLRDHNGNVHSDGTRWLQPEDIMHMDWLLDCVDGEIPGFDRLKPAAQNVVRVLGVYRDQIPPEKEGVLL